MVRRRRRFGYQAPHRKQLDGSPQASVNCGVIATGRSVDQSTRGGRSPGPAPIRVRMNEPAGPTNMWDAERAVDSYDKPAELPPGYERLKARRETDGGPGGTWSKVLDWLPDGEDRRKNGRSIVLGVHYGVLRRDAPRKTGSESFEGWHGITLTAVRTRRNGTRQVRVLDSLNDGRYRGCPQGPVWINEDRLKPACFRYGLAVHGKPQRIAGVFCSPAVRTPDDPDPDPPPVDPLEEAYEAMGEAVADLREFLDEHSGLSPGAVQDVLDIIEELEDAMPEGNVEQADARVDEGENPAKPPR